MKDYLTEQDILDQIVAKHFFVFPGTTTTVCCLTLRNGYTTIGTSACVDPDNFNAEIGERYALEDAAEKVWDLEGYALKSRLNAAY
jgi:hypothetical protein